MKPDDEKQPSISLVDAIETMYRLFAKTQVFDILASNKMIAQLLATMSTTAMLKRFAVQIDLTESIEALKSQSENENVK